MYRIFCKGSLTGPHTTGHFSKIILHVLVIWITNNDTEICFHVCALHIILLCRVRCSISFIHARYVFSLKTDDRYNRALLFQREQANILSVEDMQRVMRLNRWQTDPLSLGSSGNAIAARWDLGIQPEIMPQLHWYLRKDG